MNNLKFKFWDNEDKKMVGPFSLPQLTCYILPFTGLTDKNDKDIFDGDIVKVFYDDNIDPSFHIVKWCIQDGYPAFDLFPIISEECNSLAFACSGESCLIKVIGNIYENPEYVAKYIEEKKK